MRVDRDWGPVICNLSIRDLTVICLFTGSEMGDPVVPRIGSLFHPRGKLHWREQQGDGGRLIFGLQEQRLAKSQKTERAWQGMEEQDLKTQGANSQG